MTPHGILRDLADFVWALWREWKVLLTGGSLIALVTIWALATGVAVPYNLGWLIIALTFIGAAFMSWRRERQQAQAINAQLARELQERNALTLALQDALAPKKDPAEEYKEQEVKTWLEEFTTEEIAVIRWLLHHGDANEDDLRNSKLHERTRRIALEKGMRCGLVKSFPQGTGTAYRINAGYVDALKAVLHPPR